MMREIKGDLIALAKTGEFDVIAHGCNCFCTMGAGIAPQMAKAFGVDKFMWEAEEFKGDINKLGLINYSEIVQLPASTSPDKAFITVVNCYTQYGFGKNHEGGTAKPLDYDALTMCFKKMNHIFSGKHIGLPWIGCGLAGGDINMVRDMIKQFLTDCDVTLVEYER